MRRIKSINNIHDSPNENGYDYKSNGNMLRNNVSKALYTIPYMKEFLDILSGIFVHLTESTKNIKRWFIISIDPDDDNFT